MKVGSVPIDPDFLQAVADTARDCMGAEDERARVAGVRASLAIAEYNLRVAEFVRKESRLDDGDPTERVEHRAFAATFDRLG